MGTAKAELKARIEATKAGEDKRPLVETIERILRAEGAPVPSDLRGQLDQLRTVVVWEPLLEGTPPSTREKDASRIASALSDLHNRVVRLFEDERCHFDLIARVVRTNEERELARDLLAGDLLRRAADLVKKFADTEPLPTTLDGAQFRLATELWTVLTRQQPRIETLDGAPCGNYLEFMQAALRYLDFQNSTTFTALKDRFYRTAANAEETAAVSDSS